MAAQYTAECDILAAMPVATCGRLPAIYPEIDPSNGRFVVPLSEAASPLTQLETLWPGELPEEQRLTFVALDGERQEIALARLRAMRDYEEGRASPTELMRRLQLGRSQFYKLVRDWNATTALPSLVPYTKRRKARSSGLDQRFVDLAKEILLDQADKDITVSETTLVRTIQARASGRNLDVPADSTVRRLIARLALEDPVLQLSATGRAQQAADHTDRFGGRLLVDHSTLDLICGSDGATFRPTVSLVMDDATRLILACRLVAHVPRPSDFVDILGAAAEGYADFRSKGISAVAGLHPVLAMRTGTSSEWDNLREVARRSRFKFEIRRAPQPVFGHLLRRSMVTKIGQYQLLPRYTMRAPEGRIRPGEIGNKAIIPVNDAQLMVDFAVREHNRNRLGMVPAGAVLGTTGLRLNTERKDWLEFGLSVFQEASDRAP